MILARRLSASVLAVLAVPDLAVPVLAILALLVPARASAQPEAPAIPTGYEVAQHVVRAEDTLWALTEHYLGSLELLPTILQLNAGVDPLALVPGSRVSVLVVRSAGSPAAAARAARAALLTHWAGRVEERPRTLEWLPAETGDLLLERDAARTARASSARLQFLDGTSLRLGEASMVLLRREGSRLRATEGRTIEIVEGSADIDARGFAAIPNRTVELVLGTDIVAIPPATPTSTRAARESNRSRIGVYEGRATFTGGGAAIDLDRGEGVVAEAGAQPAKEDLLGPPQLVTPAPGARWFDVRPLALEWQAPPGNPRSYAVEICRDAACAELVMRAAGLTTTSWRPAGLALGSYHWRVTAASASTLDGYPSAPRAFELAATNDTTPPIVRVSLRGGTTPTDGRYVLAEAPQLAVEASDSGTDVARTWLVVNGSERAADLPWPPGDYRVAAAAEDHAGNHAESDPLELRILAPPSIAVVRIDTPLAADNLADRADATRTLVQWSLGSGWRPLEAERIDVMSAPHRISIRPFVDPCLDITGGPLCPGQGLDLTAVAGGAPVRRLRVHLETTANGAHRVVVVAEDQLGHRGRLEIPIRSAD